MRRIVSRAYELVLKRKLIEGAPGGVFANLLC